MNRLALNLKGVLALGVLFSGCGPTVSVGEVCGLQRDQWDSLDAVVATDSVVEVWVHPDFNSTEQGSIQRGVDQWNEVAVAASGHPLLRTRVGTFNGLAPSSRLTTCDFNGGNSRAFAVLRETRMDVWTSMNMSDANPGFTVRCKAGGNLSKQVVLLNPDLIPLNQLSTVVLHELGHAMGLDHSCQQGGGSNRFRSCSGIPETHPYRQAVMFPTLRIGETAHLSRREAGNPALSSSGISFDSELRTNDMERARCLYGN